MRWDNLSGNHRKEAKPKSEPESCRYCHGRGTEADYVGLEMRCVEVECSACGGSGLHNKLND